MVEPLIPPPLAPGDAIGIIAPSGQIPDRQKFESGLQILREMGFEVKSPSSLWPGSGYFSDTDTNRAEEFNHVWANPQIHAVMAVRGGYGCLRILEQIDLQLVRNTPKLIIGFSDLTVLHTFLQQETGLVCLHGPVLTSLAGSGRTTIERFKQCLMGHWSETVTEKITLLRGGKTRRGLLAGGNLSSIITLLGTRFEPIWTNKIVFLEDTNEPLYRIDRMLTQLFFAGKFNDINGLILGDFSISNDQEPQARTRHHDSVWHRALELTAQLDIPIWAGFPAGHQKDNLTLPIGAEATMESKTLSLQFP